MSRYTIARGIVRVGRTMHIITLTAFAAAMTVTIAAAVLNLVQR